MGFGGKCLCTASGYKPFADWYPGDWLTSRSKTAEPISSQVNPNGLTRGYGIPCASFFLNPNEPKTMSGPTEFLIGVYIGYMMIANYRNFKEGCKILFNR